MKGFVVATQFLTRLPTPRLAVSDTEFAASMRWFPAVGFVVGALVAGAAWAGARLDPWIGALAGLVAWIAVTGALHLDGLGDIADASGAAHKDRERMLSVMSDPHVGSFAVVSIGVQLAAKMVLLHALVAMDAFVPLVLAPFAGRIGPLVWSRWLPDLHRGLGSRFRGAVRNVDLGCWAIMLIACAWIVPGLLAAPVLIFGWGTWLRVRIGGISGDGHGAGIEVCESGLLLAALIAARLM